MNAQWDYMTLGVNADTDKIGNVTLEVLDTREEFFIDGSPQWKNINAIQDGWELVSIFLEPPGIIMQTQVLYAVFKRPVAAMRPGYHGGDSDRGGTSWK